MGLLPKRISCQGRLGGATRAAKVAGPESSAGHIDQGVLVAIGEALAFGGKAVVSESLDQVAAIELDRSLGSTIATLEAALEGDGIDLESGLREDRHGFRPDIEHVVWIDTRVDEPVTDQPQCLTKRSDGRAVSVRPEVRGDGLPRSRPACQDEQREQRRGVAATEPYLGPARRSNVQSPEQVHAKDRRLDLFVSWHGIPEACRPATPGPSPRGPGAGLGTAGPRPAVPRRPQPDGCAPARPSVQSRIMSSTASVSDPIPDTAGVGQPTPSDARPERFDTLTGTVPIAAIGFHFDPLLRLADTLAVRWQTIALATVIALALIVAGVLARRAALRPDDLLFIAIGIVPGAVVGGRIGYALLHLDFYAADPVAILDPATGGLELGLAAAGGLLTAWYVARLLGAPTGPWLQVAIQPVLFTLGVGKLTMVLGGSGQGQPSDAPWATAYPGPGPWSSLAPALPSHPSQAYEGIATLVVLGVVGLLLAGTGPASRGRSDGRVFLFGLGAWALVRAAAGLTWRDPVVVGPLNAGSLIALGLAAACFASIAAFSVRSRSDGATSRAPASTVPDPPVPVGTPRS